MNQFSRSILIAVAVLFAGPITAPAGLFPEGDSDSESAALLSPIASQEAGLNQMKRSMSELSEIEARARSARNRSDIHSLIQENQRRLIESSDINVDPFANSQEEAVALSGSENAMPDREFRDLKLDGLHASLEAEILADRLIEIETFEDPAPVERGSAPSVLSQFRPAHLIPEPTSTAFLTLAGISFAASQYRRRRRRMWRQR